MQNESKSPNTSYQLKITNQLDYVQKAKDEFVKKM